MKQSSMLLAVLALVSSVVAACGDDDDDGAANGGNTRPEDTGAACETAEDCYPDVAEGALEGEAMCLDRVRDGYCTHECAVDEDCCAAEGECDAGLHQVCSPFESTGTLMCFVSCEEEDVSGAGFDDDGQYCQERASRDFICRSSGGGSQNRKICVPGDCGVGAACASDADCAAGLECSTGLRGGYCTLSGCSTNDECPADSLCVRGPSDTSYCARGCSVASDCSFCRGSELAANCSDEADFVQDGTTGSVCLP